MLMCMVSPARRWCILETGRWLFLISPGGNDASVVQCFHLGCADEAVGLFQGRHHSRVFLHLHSQSLSPPLIVVVFGKGETLSQPHRHPGQVCGNYGLQVPIYHAELCASARGMEAMAQAVTL